MLTQLMGIKDAQVSPRESLYSRRVGRGRA